MKILKNTFFFLLVLTMSCSSSDDSIEEEQQQNGSLAITFSDGRSYVMENINTSMNNDYSASNALEIDITATTPLGTGNLALSIKDIGVMTQNITNGNTVSFNINETLTHYATLSFAEGESFYYAETGTIEIQSFISNGNNSQLTAIFNSSDGSGLTLSGNINALEINCLECQ